MQLMAALTDLVGLVGFDAVHRTAIVGRVDRDAANAQLISRPEDPDGDLAAVGDEQLRDHDGMPAPTAPRNADRPARRSSSARTRLVTTATSRRRVADDLRTRRARLEHRR
jgi:hypothetical protein